LVFESLTMFIASVPRSVRVIHKDQLTMGISEGHRPENGAGIDPILLPFLAAADAQTAEIALEELIAAEAYPRIRDIVGYKLRQHEERRRAADDCADVQSEILLQLVARLSELRANPHSHAIHDFRGYVAVAAYRSCYDYLRRKYPQRHSLKQRIRRVLVRAADLDCWEADGIVLCGQKERRGSASQSATGPNFIASFRESFPALSHFLASRGTANEAGLGDTLREFFRQVPWPVELDDLVAIMMEFQPVGSICRTALSEEEREQRMNQLRADPMLAERLSHRAYLNNLWKEIEQMSSRHCTALLLHLRDDRGESPMDLFLTMQIAPFPQIAAVLGMKEEELAGLWNRLPLDDAAIAERLGLRRQQIINLRSSARERLARRMKARGLM
jgi:hypothetical protein